MIKIVNEGNNVSRDLSPAIDEFLQDIAQMYGGISYGDIMDHNYTEDDIRKLSNLRRRANKWADEMMEDEFDDYMKSKIVPSVKSILGK